MREGKSQTDRREETNIQTDVERPGRRERQRQTDWEWGREQVERQGLETGKDGRE